MQNMILAPVNWAQVGIVLGVFAAIALLLTVCILLVARFCKTNADEKVENILSHLAGANCGGCGCTGCAGFAEKLARGEAQLSDCHVTETSEKAEIAKVLGVPFSASKPTVSVCRCSGGTHAKDGLPICRRAGLRRGEKARGRAQGVQIRLPGRGKLHAGVPRERHLPARRVRQRRSRQVHLVRGVHPRLPQGAVRAHPRRREGVRRLLLTRAAEKP